MGQDATFTSPHPNGKRGLLKRSKLADGNRLVTITAQGDRARKAADPIHADAVMRHFISKLTGAQRKAIASLGVSHGL